MHRADFSFWCISYWYISYWCLYITHSPPSSWVPCFGLLPCRIVDLSEHEIIRCSTSVIPCCHYKVINTKLSNLGLPFIPKYKWTHLILKSLNHFQRFPLLFLDCIRQVSDAFNCVFALLQIALIPRQQWLQLVYINAGFQRPLKVTLKCILQPFHIIHNKSEEYVGDLVNEQHQIKYVNNCIYTCTYLPVGFI